MARSKVYVNPETRSELEDICLKKSSLVGDYILDMLPVWEREIRTWEDAFSTPENWDIIIPGYKGDDRITDKFIVLMAGIPPVMYTDYMYIRGPVIAKVLGCRIIKRRNIVETAIRKTYDAASLVVKDFIRSGKLPTSITEIAETYNIAYRQARGIYMMAGGNDPEFQQGVTVRLTPAHIERIRSRLPFENFHEISSTLSLIGEISTFSQTGYSLRKMIETIDSNRDGTMMFYTSKEKFKVYNLMTEMIKQHLPSHRWASINYIGLPGISFGELMTFLSSGFYIERGIGAERDRELCWLAQRRAYMTQHLHNITMHHGSLHRVIEDSLGEFDVANIDLSGPLSIDAMKSVFILFNRRKLARRSCLFLNVSLGNNDRWKNNPTGAPLMQKDPESSLPNLIKMLASRCGYRVNRIAVQRYVTRILGRSIDMAFVGANVSRVGAGEYTAVPVSSITDPAFAAYIRKHIKKWNSKGR